MLPYPDMVDRKCLVPVDRRTFLTSGTWVHYLETNKNKKLPLHAFMPLTLSSVSCYPRLIDFMPLLLSSVTYYPELIDFDSFCSKFDKVCLNLLHKLTMLRDCKQN